MTKSIKLPKTCVYAIALNEIMHVDNFMAGCLGADLVLVCDTGSTDGTQQRLRELGAVVYDINQTPWRFDIPRNTALNLIPADIDICLSIDLDEYLQPGWLEEIQQCWQETAGRVTRIRYDYIWNWQEDGVTPEGRFFTSKIHSRIGYQWRYPCHELIYYVGDESQELTVTLPNLHLHHRADPNKSRGSYLPLLELGVKEDPTSDRMRHYYGRELMYHSQWAAAIKELEHHLTMPAAWWKEERAASLRYISICHRHLGQLKESQAAAMRAVAEWDTSREPWMELANAAYANSDWYTCYWAATKTLSLTTPTDTYRVEARNWGAKPHDHAALAAYHLGLYSEAVKQGRAAVRLAPSDERLTSNLEFYIQSFNTELQLA
jgi:glycosyltransferase involved in cell wall biosynthesis